MSIFILIKKNKLSFVKSDPVQVFSDGWNRSGNQLHPDPQPCFLLDVNIKMNYHYTLSEPGSSFSRGSDPGLPLLLNL